MATSRTFRLDMTRMDLMHDALRRELERIARVTAAVWPQTRRQMVATAPPSATATRSRRSRPVSTTPATLCDPTKAPGERTPRAAYLAAGHCA
jgi:hypothetical protein